MCSVISPIRGLYVAERAASGQQVKGKRALTGALPSTFEEDDSGCLLVHVGVASKPSCAVVAFQSVSITLLLKSASPDVGKDRFRYVF